MYTFKSLGYVRKNSNLVLPSDRHSEAIQPLINYVFQKPVYILPLKAVYQSIPYQFSNVACIFFGKRTPIFTAVFVYPEHARR